MDTSLALTPRHQSEDKLDAIRNALHWCKLIVIATGKWTDRIELYLEKRCSRSGQLQRNTKTHRNRYLFGYCLIKIFVNYQFLKINFTNLLNKLRTHW